jgi:tetratricopeptide (TPR) repeat protein
LILDNQEKYDEAIASYDKAIEADPKYADAYFNKGLILDNQEKYHEAISLYNNAIEADPKYARAYFSKGLILDDQEKYDEAIASYDKAIEADPNNPAYYNGKAWSLANLGRNEEALSLIKQSLSLNKENLAAIHTEGRILLNLGNYVEADKRFSNVIDGFSRSGVVDDSNLFDAWYDKARSLMRQKRTDDALNHLQKAINLGGEKYVSKAKSDKDFDEISNNKEFIKLVK